MPREKDPFRDFVEFLGNKKGTKLIWKCKFCNKEYQGSVTRIKAHLAGVTGLGISECKAVDPQVRSQARKSLKGKGATESINRSEGNVEEGPHQAITANNEDGQRGTLLSALMHPGLWEDEPSWVLTVPNESVPSQITKPGMCASFQTPADDSNVQPQNIGYPSSSQDLAPEDLTNMPLPSKAEEGEPNPQVSQDARTDDALVDSRPGTFEDIATLKRKRELVDKDMPTLKRKFKGLSSQDADMHESMTLCRKAVRIARECLKVIHAFREDRSLAAPQVQKLEDLSEEVEDILGHCSFAEGSIAHAAGCRKSLPLLTTELVGDECKEIIKGICNYLMKDEISIIGIWGMGGVGKTSILMHVHNRVLKNPVFNDVFWVTVPQEFYVYELQDKIANASGLKILSKDKDVKRRACILNQHLKKKKRVLLILDGLWMHFNIEDVGIPIEKGGIKLVMATRSLDVCHKMLCQRQIKVGLLNEFDGQSLFLEKLCFMGELPLKIKEITRFIVRKCGGLPLGIIEIATHMRGVDEVCIWKDMSRKLKDSNVELAVFKTIKLSYVKLSNPQLQQCFLHLLLCFGFEKNRLDDTELIESLIDEDLLDEIGTRQELHDQGNAILDKFRKDCLWIPIEEEEPIEEQNPMVHPLTRDMALNMLNSMTHMVKAHKGLKEIPEEKFWTSSLEKVYLQGNRIEDIPDGISPNCPKLTRLSLNGNVFLKDIHESFFSHLNGLKVVDLSYTRITKLAEAICHLEVLEALLLRQCGELCHIPCVRKLESLKKLDLQGCENLEEVPEGMEALVKLRFLNLQGTKIELLPKEVLGKMVNLQYLFIDTMMEEEEESREVEGLYCFTPNIETYNAYVSFLEQHNFQRYQLVLSVAGDYFCKDDYDRSIIIESCHGIAGRGDREIGEDGCALIPGTVQMLEVRQCESLTNLCEFGQLEELEELEIRECAKLEELGAIHFPHLWILTITGCSKLKHLWEEMGGSQGSEGIDIVPPRFPNLKRMCICDCRNLEEIIVGSFPTATTSLLEALYISECPNLKGVLLMHDVWRYLPSLKEMTVEDCEGIEVIIGTAPNMTPSTSPSISFPKLTHLRLWNLPELKSICDGTLSFPSIQWITIWRCPKLKRISLKLLPLPSLRGIRIDQQNWQTLEWNDTLAPSLLKPFIQFVK